MYTLYYLPGACSLAVHVALIETGAAFKLENVAVADGQPRPAAFLKVNPRGSVPVLQDGNFVIREGAAILTYLLDEANHELLPQSGKERAAALEWLAFANSTLHPAYGRVFWLKRNAKAELEALTEAGIAAIQKLWDDVEAQLASQPYLCGNKPTIADILVTVIANWTPYFGKTVNFGPHTKALFTSIISRPSYQQAMKAEQVEYKVAA